MHQAKRRSAHRIVADGSQGWLKAVRVSCGEGYKEAAERLGKSIGTVHGFEEGELAGTISLKSMRSYAEAYGFRMKIELEPVDPTKRKLFRKYREAIARTELGKNLLKGDEARMAAIDQINRAQAVLKLAAGFLASCSKLVKARGDDESRECTLQYVRELDKFAEDVQRL